MFKFSHAPIFNESSLRISANSSEYTPKVHPLSLCLFPQQPISPDIKRGKSTHTVLKSHKIQLTSHHETVPKQHEATAGTLRDFEVLYKFKIIHGDVSVKGRSQNSEAGIQ